MPAFVTRPGLSVGVTAQLVETLVLLPKPALHELFVNGSVQRFDPGKPGNAATDYAR